MEPELYRGKEQTLLKHRVLAEYLESWGIKLGSTTRKLWYVDCFAGPWRATGDTLDDTSAAVSLKALREARDVWPVKFSVGAIFVEPDDEAYLRLDAYRREHAGDIDAHAIHGRFGDHVGEIRDRLGGDAAFIFVDPTGWKGADMRFIAELTRERYRDVMINVMFDFLNRARHMSHEFLAPQLRAFFGLHDDLPAGLDEEEVFALYRSQLKRLGGLDFAADVAVKHATRDRTWFRLVVGGKDPKVLELMRQVEKKVLGEEAGVIRDRAKHRVESNRTGQLVLSNGLSPSVDSGYRELQAAGMARAEVLILEELRRRGEVRYRDLWPTVLENCHITKTDAGSVMTRLRETGQILVVGLGPRERTVKDDHMVRIVGALVPPVR